MEEAAQPLQGPLLPLPPSPLLEWILPPHPVGIGRLGLGMERVVTTLDGTMRTIVGSLSRTVRDFGCKGQVLSQIWPHSSSNVCISVPVELSLLVRTQTLSGSCFVEWLSVSGCDLRPASENPDLVSFLALGSCV